MTDDELAALAANDDFYDAFAQRDLEAMDELWARARPVTCIHPGWTMLVGRDDVMKSWRAILHSENPVIEATSARAQVIGDAAYVVCFEGERGRPPMLAATNVFAREGGGWKMIHHHAGPVAHAVEPVRSGSSN